jgi:hypothetical protein
MSVKKRKVKNKRTPGVFYGVGVVVEVHKIPVLS